MTQLWISAFVWIALHVGASFFDIRARAISRIGKENYLKFHTIAAVCALAFMIISYAYAENGPGYWEPLEGSLGLVGVLVFLSAVFIAGSFTTTNPTIVGQGRKMEGIGFASGMIRVTRHPFLWGVSFLSSAHLIGAASLRAHVMFGALFVVSSVGTVLIDKRKASQMGEVWRDFSAVTSNVPFVAIFQGRNQFRPKELLLPLALGAASFLFLINAHEFIPGRPLMTR